MSVQQLEQSVRDLNPDQLAQFASWFDAYRSTFGEAEEEEPELSAEQRTEIDRRLDELDANPSITLPWEGTTAALRKEFDALYPPKTDGH